MALAIIPIRDVPGSQVQPSGNELILIDNGIEMQKASINDAVTPKATQIADDKIAALNLGSASQANIEDFATAAQGLLADTAVQPSRAITAGAGLTGGGTLEANREIALNSTSIASLALADTAVQPARQVSAGTGLTGGGDLSADRTISLNATSVASLAKADSAVQPGDLATVATSGDYDDLSNKPTLGTAAAMDAGAFATAAQGLLADTAVQPSREITAGAGLTGGGTLEANREIALNSTSIATLEKAEAAGSFLKDAVFVNDWNAINISGVYRSNSNGQAPIGGPAELAHLIVYHVETTGGRAWQIAFSPAGNAQWRRGRNGSGVWSEWEREALLSEVEAVADSSVRRAAGHPVSLFLDGSAGTLFDFSDRVSLGIETTADTVSRVNDLLRRNYFRVPGANTPPKPVLADGRLALRSIDNSDMLITEAHAPLLPASGDFVLAWSHRTETTGPKAVLWQNESGATGRVQIGANARYTGSSNAPTDGYLQVFMAGATEGNGINGMIAAAQHPVGQWADFVLILRDGTQQSEFWRNGVLVDRFTRPATIPEVTTSLFRSAAAPSWGAGQTIGRLLCLHRAPADGEIELIRAWLRASFTSDPAVDGGQSWTEPTISSTSAIIRSRSFVEGIEPVEIWGKAPDTVLRPASMTKLMTAHVGLNWLKQLDALDTLFERVSGDSGTGSGNNLSVGDILDTDNALANMGLPSSNVTANMWGRTIGGLILAHEGQPGDPLARFISEMNDEASRIGMANSIFGNASGLDSGDNFSTARDIALLCEIASSANPEIAEIWSHATWPLVITGSNPRTITITHSVKFIQDGDARVVWGKTGTSTQGGNCLLCEVRAPRGNRYFYVGFGASSDANRYVDGEAVFSAAESGIDWPTLVPVVRP